MTIVPAMTEHELMDGIIAAGRRLGYRVYHTHDSRHSAAGFPDLVLVGTQYGAVLYVECKSDRGSLRPAQREWIEALRDIGELTYVVRPKDYDGFLEVLQEWAG